MNVWCHLPTIFKQRYALQRAGLIALCVAFITTLLFVAPSHAATGVNQTLSFQGRLQSSAGAVVPDGYYNIQFKIYQDGAGTSAGNSGGTLKWTESYVNNNGTSGVQVKNGYFSVTLGSKTAFGSSIDWNQDTLWLSMNVAGKDQSCTTFDDGACEADGEMLPMKRLTAVPYAMQAQNANTLGGMEASDLVHNQNTAQQTSSNFWISGTGRADTALQAPAIDTASVGTLTIGSTNATSITVGNSSSTTTLAGDTVATGDFSVKNASNTPLLNVDTNSNTVSLGQTVTTNGVRFGNTNWGNAYTPYSANSVLASRYQTGGTAGLTAQVTVRAINGMAAPSNKFQMAIYADNAGTPGTLIAQTGVGVLDNPSNGYMTLAISATLSPNTYYWLAYMTNGADPNNNNLIYESGAGTSCALTHSYSSVFPSSLASATCGGTNAYVINVDFAGSPSSAVSIDSSGNVGIGVTGPGHKLQVAGDALIQTLTNTSDAFSVQNAAGTDALRVDTTNNSVLVAGTLDTTSVTGLTLGGTNATSITIGKSSSNIATTVLGTAIFKPTTGNDSTTAFQIQRANGTAMLVADSTNQTITFGNSGSGNYTVISTSTGAITKYGNARNTKKITLNAEYTGSVLDGGTGSNNTGTMTSSVDLTNRMNYYKWTTSQASNQSYDVVVQVPIPSDFDGWASSNPLSISTYTSNTTNGTITLEARDSSNAVQCNFVSVTPGSTGAWATNSSACTLSSGTYTAGDQMTLRIRLQSPTSGDVRVGNINLSYLSKY